MDKKKMLKDGVNKKQVFLIISKDINGKEHFTVIEDLELVKKYKDSSEKVCPVSYFFQLKIS